MSETSRRRPLAIMRAAARCIASALVVAGLSSAIGVAGAVATAYLVAPGSPAGAGVCPSCPRPTPFPDPTAYVANNGSGTVSVIDAAKNTVTTTVRVGSGPTGVAVDTANGAVYVTNTDSNSVSVLSGSTDTVTDTIHLGHGTAPTGVAITPSGSTAYVADSGTNTVSVIDTSTNAVTKKIRVGTVPSAVVVGAVGAYAYVTNFLSNTVSVIAVGSNTVTKTIPVGFFPSAVASSPTGSDVYVTNECGADRYCDKFGTVSVISTSTFAVTNTYATGYAPVAVTVAPNDNVLYVVNSCGPILTSGGPDCADVNGTDPANVTWFLASTMGILDQTPIGNAQPGLAEGAATSPDSSEVYTVNSCGSSPSCAFGGTVSVWSSDNSDAPIATITVGNDPLGVAFVGPWQTQRRQTSLSTDATPALASIGQTLYAAEIVGGAIRYESYDIAAGTWSSALSVPDSTAAYAPALTADGSTLWVAWTTSKGTIEYDELSTTSGKWELSSPETVPEAGTNQAPSLTTMDDLVYVAWKGTRTDQIGFSDFSVFSGWSEQSFVPSATTSATPAIAAGVVGLDFAWKGMANSRVYFDSAFDGTWTKVVQPQAQTNVRPALAVTSDGSTYVMWTGKALGSLTYSLDTPNGWTQQQFVPSALSGAGPALTAAGANVYAAWQGLGNTTFWYDSLD